jgi:bacillithiol biosynthesis cysteine-adding enzyme BshC
MQLIERSEPLLYQEGPFTSFLSLSPSDPNGADISRGFLNDRSFKRAELARILEDYNSSIGNDQFAAEQINSFRQNESVCIFTGQQLGMFGGPAYTVLKAISCLILARKHHAVPIFWLATEDHDVSEIHHTYLIDNLGNLNKFHLCLPKDGRFVEDLHLTEANSQVIQRFCDVINRMDLAEMLKGETSYARAMAKVMVELFKGTGLVFVEPYLLRPFATEIFKKEILESHEIATTLRETTERLVKSGGEAVLDVSEETNLFIKMKGQFRCKIQRENGRFKAGSHLFGQEELVALIESEPERFSANACGRCVLQNLLFPVLAYVAGPGELAYYHQLKDYHAYHGISMPWIVPRMSASLLTPIAQEMLGHVGVQPWEQIPDCWTDLIPGIEGGATELTQEWMASASNNFGKDLSEESMSRFIRFQSKKLEKKAVLSRLRKRGIPPHSLHYLKNLLHPHEKPQERVLNWWEFQSHTDNSIIQYLLKNLNEIPRGHVYCYL